MVWWKKQVYWSAAAAALLVAGPAAPCSPFCRDAPVYLFPKQAEVPGNLIRFRLLVADPGPLELRAKGGALVPASITKMGLDRVFAPSAPVPAGTELTLHYELRCAGIRKGVAGEYTFQVGPPAKVELRGAELVVHEQGTRDPGSAWNETGFVRVSYYSPESSGNAGHLIQSTVTLDGRPYRFDERLSQSGNPVIEVASDCMLRGGRDSGGDGYAVDSCGALRSVPPGVHKVEVKPHLVGGDVELAPVSLEVTTVCPRGLIPTPAASELQPIPPPPASAKARPAGSVRLAGADGGSPRKPEPKSSGCALAVPATQTPRALALLVAVAALTPRLRRRLARGEKQPPYRDG
jgi:hypothetical protein